MKVAVWIVFGLLAVLWTGGALLMSELTQWGAQLLAVGEALNAEPAAQWPIPAWMSPWVDPAWAQAAQKSLMWTLQMLRGFSPMMGSAAGLVVSLIWVLWGLGAVLMLGLAVGAHVLLERMPSKRATPEADASSGTPAAVLQRD